MFRFSLANVLRAMAWMCVSGACFSMLREAHHQSQVLPQSVLDALAIPLAFLMIWSPFVAVGALFGATKRGMLIGLAVFAFLVVITFMMLPRVH